MVGLQSLDVPVRVDPEHLPGIKWVIDIQTGNTHWVNEGLQPSQTRLVSFLSLYIPVQRDFGDLQCPANLLN
jgi:hypothetical protein